MAGDPRIVGPLSAIGVHDWRCWTKIRRVNAGAESVGLASFGAMFLAIEGALLPYLRDVSPLVLLGGGLVAAVFVVIGMRGARGMRDPFMALTSIGTPALLAAGVWFLWGPRAFHNEAFLRFFAIPFAIGFALRLFLSLRDSPAARKRWSPPTSRRMSLTGIER